MKSGAAHRKVNYAVYVKTNMPVSTGVGIAKKPKEMNILPKKTGAWRNKMLADVKVVYIIAFTWTTADSRVPHARKRCQARHPAATRNSKSAASRRHRSAVCPGQLLRSQRSGPGQVRDAAPRA